MHVLYTTRMLAAFAASVLDLIAKTSTDLPPDVRAAMRGAFVARGRVDMPSHVLLVDDVLTTGATAAACAEVLLAHGVTDVTLVVAARALLRSGRRAILDRAPRPGLWLPGDHPR